MVPSQLLRDSFSSRLPAVGSVELPHMLHPSPTCSAYQGAGVLRLGNKLVRPSSSGTLSHRSLSIGPSSPLAQTSTAAPGPALEKSRFLQFNYNGILHCHAELQDFLHRHQVLVDCVQETKLGVNSSLKELQTMPLSGVIARPGVAMGDLSPSFTTPSPRGCLTVAFSPMMTRRKFWHSRPTLGEPH